MRQETRDRHRGRHPSAREQAARAARYDARKARLDRERTNLQELGAPESDSIAADLTRALEAAYQALEDGTYGKCRGCRKDIPEERLDDLPLAQHCIGCVDLA